MLKETKNQLGKESKLFDELEELIEKRKDYTEEYERLFGGELAQQVKKTNDSKKQSDELVAEMDKTLERKAKEAKAIRIESEYDELFGDLEKVLQSQTEKVDVVSKQYEMLFGELERSLKEKVQHFTNRINDQEKEYNILFGDLEKELKNSSEKEKEKEEKEEKEEEEIKGIDDEPCIYRSNEKVPCSKTEEDENEKLGTRLKHEPCPEIENKCKASGTSWGHTIVNDMKTGNTPKWGEFFGDFLPPNVKLFFALFETFAVIAKNKDAIVKTGQKYIQNKITSNIKEVEKAEKEEKVEEEEKVEKEEKVNEKEEKAEKEEKVNEDEKKGGGFTYEDCFF